MMTQTTDIPAQILPPGHILAKELEKQNISQADLAEILDRPSKTLNAIIRAKKEITAQTATELEKALGIPAKVLLNLQNNYQLAIHRQNMTAEMAENEEMIAIRSRIYKFAPVRELIKKGWLNFTDNVKTNAKILSEYLEEDILAPGIEDKLKNFSVNYRHSTKLVPTSEALLAWTQRVKILAREQGKLKYSEKKFRKALPELLSFMDDEKKLSQIPDFFLKHGVHFVIVPHLQKTYLDGAMIVDNGQPIIALTLRHDRIDNFYFSLLHEVGHLLLGHGKTDEIFLDTLDAKDEQDDKEKDADDFAYQHLLPQDAWNSFCAENTSFPKAKIIQFAQEHQRHPGIILGQLQYRGKVSYGHQRQLLSKVKPFFEGAIDTA